MIKRQTFNNRFSEKQIQNIVKEAINELDEYKKQEEYYKGDNEYILHTRAKEPASNDDASAKIWEMPVSYGRKIVKTISGYMYKPGLITYQIDNKQDKELIELINKANDETILNNKLGSYAAANGQTYELHYIENNIIKDTIDYKMTMIKAKDAIAVYNHDIDPKMTTFIRVLKIEGRTQYEVYYADEIILYEEVDDNESPSKDDIRLEEIARFDNVFYIEGDPGINVIEYKNNEENISDIWIVKQLIDAYDVINSTSMIEFDKFAFAYLKLVGSALSSEDTKKVRAKKIFANLENKDAVSYLTKDITTEFIEKTADRIKREIHRQTFIPDIDDIQFSGAASGVAIDKFIYLMEYTASDKEAYFRKALHERFKLINRIKPIQDIDGIKIDCARNLPSSDYINSQIYANLDGKGISRETLQGHLFAWIENPVEELEKFSEEEDKRIEKNSKLFGDQDEEQESAGFEETIEE